MGRCFENYLSRKLDAFPKPGLIRLLADTVFCWLLAGKGALIKGHLLAWKEIKPGSNHSLSSGKLGGSAEGSHILYPTWEKLQVSKCIFPS